VPTILVWVAVGTAFFGYRAVSAYGTSMEPSLRSGDALWEKPLDATDIKVGGILTLVSPGEGSITHRVVKIEPLSTGSYLLATKGDVNHFTEEWEISADWKAAVVVARIPWRATCWTFSTASSPGS
jgi:signal peptidase I